MTSASPAVSSTAERSSEFAGRQAPWSNEAEQAVLGAMLLDQDAALKAAEFLDDTMFYREGHRLLFRAMIALTERGDGSFQTCWLQDGQKGIRHSLVETDAAQ